MAGVLSAVALGRLRRRHAYRYRPPEPGRHLGPDPLRPTLRRLASARCRDVEPGDVSKVQKKLESARVKLAKQEDSIGQVKPQ